MIHSDAEEEDGGIQSYFDCHFPGASRVSVDDDTEQLTPMCQPHQRQKHSSENNSLISRIKQSFSVSPISQFLGSHTRASSENSEVELEVANPSTPQLEDSHTPTRYLSNFRSVFSSPRSNSHSRSNTSSSTCSYSSTTSPSVPDRKSHFCASSKQLSLFESLGTPSSQLDSPALTTSSVIDDTPPVTPCLPGEEVSHPDIAFDAENGQKKSASIKIRDDGSVCGEAKKGKEPAPSFPYETLLADISSSVEPELSDMVDQDNNSEWWGLEYTLELSRKDSRASDASEETGGEHSKSRESWAAIHQGTVPPVYEDSNFHEWQKWHRSLDKMEMKKRKRRTIEFIEESDRLATIFVYEMQARRALELYEDKLTDEEIYEVLMWIEYTSEQRQDPFDPKESHSLGWVLKNHRSFASLRDFAVLSPY